MNQKAADFVHAYTNENGERRYAVAWWNEKQHSYEWPTSTWVRRHDGASWNYSHRIEGCPSYETYRAAYHQAYNMFCRKGSNR